MTDRTPSTFADDYEDINLTCFVRDCGMQFVWTAGEQAFMAQLYHAGRIQEITQPKRCHACREEKRKHFANRDQHHGNNQEDRS